MSWGGGYGYSEYVPVAERKAKARSFAAKRAEKQGRDVQSVEIKGSKIAKTFWGKAWCEHLESFSDYSNRLPRGRTYARNGSVADLQIDAGRIEAIVGGSDVYQIRIDITKLNSGHWKKIRNDCSASIDSLLDLLAGRFSDGVMERLTDRKSGLFPSPREISLDCDCPDGARLCKHLAAVLYGVGARLDKSPELLFLLRDVDHTELVSEAVSDDNLSAAFGAESTDLAGEDLSAMFGIELDSLSSKEGTSKKGKSNSAKAKEKPAKGKARKVRGKKSEVQGSAKKKAVKKAATKKATPSKKPVKKKPVKKKPVKKKPVKKKPVKKKPVKKKPKR